ncbi:TPA: ribonuclease P protein component [Staphylococcus aureus]|nr:ribonuclease P protein component [Staphylococcus aureus]
MLLEKAYRIKKNADFQRIYKKGHSVANRQFVVYTCNNKEIDHFRLGISVSKKLGNAVLRNKIKRAIRENFKVHKSSHILAKDIIVIARQPAKDMTTLQIQNSLEHVLKIAKVFNKKIK